MAAAACAASTDPTVSASASQALGANPNKFSAPAVRSAVNSLNDRPLSTPSSTAAGAYRGQRVSDRKSSVRTMVSDSAACAQGPSCRSCCSASSLAGSSVTSPTDSNLPLARTSSTPAVSAPGINSTAASVTVARMSLTLFGRATVRARVAILFASS